MVVRRAETADLRAATWNLWWRFGNWEARHDAIIATIRDLQPDILALQEVWCTPERDQAAEIAAELGYYFVSLPAPSPEHWQRRIPGSDRIDVCNAVLSRWPIRATRITELAVPSMPEVRAAVLARTDTQHGTVEVCCTHLSSNVAGGSGIRARQLDQLSGWLAREWVPGVPRLLMGDLNAEPDSDEIRRLGGHLTDPYHAGEVWVDAWRFRTGNDPGYSLRRDNPHAAAHREPWARLDYVFLAHTRAGMPDVHGVELFAVDAMDGVFASDHAGVVVDFSV